MEPEQCVTSTCLAFVDFPAVSVDDVNGRARMPDGALPKSQDHVRKLAVSQIRVLR